VQVLEGAQFAQVEDRPEVDVETLGPWPVNTVRPPVSLWLAALPNAS
jgi:hypothetical protein